MGLGVLQPPLQVGTQWRNIGEKRGKKKGSKKKGRAEGGRRKSAPPNVVSYIRPWEVGTETLR